jgi:hypothetical protein
MAFNTKRKFDDSEEAIQQTYVPTKVPCFGLLTPFGRSFIGV